jgi:hypothetical protein
MHPPEVREAALALIAAGYNDCEIARRTGVARTTIRDWRRPTYARTTELEICHRCWRPSRPMSFSPDDYAELLGLYLGDGWISAGARTYRLRIALDAGYPQILREAKALLARCFPANHVGNVSAEEGRMRSLSVYSSHLPCLFPQHGAGAKHARAIVLEDWQTAILESAPWPFIRACIRTDGCSFVNRTGPYEYLSYDFTNMSSEIAGLFVAACDRVGVRVRTTRSSMGAWRVRINRRAAVALMLEHVGLKS